MVNQFSLKKKVKDISALHGSGEVLDSYQKALWTLWGPTAQTKPLLHRTHWEDVHVVRVWDSNSSALEGGYMNPVWDCELLAPESQCRKMNRAAQEEAQDGQWLAGF